MSVRPSVRPSKKVSSISFNEIWYVGRGRRVMLDGMQYDSIQGQGQGHEPFGYFQRLFLSPFIMGLANDHGFLN